MKEISNIAMTHGGKFHADDVFSSALLKIINPAIKIIRTFEVPQNFDGIVYDIGGGRFDHHQAGAEVRENGVPYAAFGLLWREFGEGLVGAEEAARLDERFVQPLDLDDNTGCGNAVAGIIGSFNPSWDSDEDVDSCFLQAVDFAMVILQKKLESIRSILRARELVQHALEHSADNIVVLPRFAPWKMVLIPSDADFVVYPSQRGGYSAQGVPTEDETNALKCEFPQEWAGKTAQELKKLTGIDSLRFCHNNRFLVATDTAEDAVRACKLAREW
ncbi:MYG1 family protein [Hydrogenoanaerobacterium sp.]|uniref:MYG1 family protein n=1 Tax=Hydrogenoanaerobacterium sp. TaxID=2953763 RepID=UPI00289E598D|nr:MYG1 family protein [Hydrogenoanaerobacterium sp.]